LFVISFGVVMCRLAARSDDAHVAELAEWVAAGQGASGEVARLEARGDQLPLEVQSGRYRATG
jgi:hypothetical protein